MDIQSASTVERELKVADVIEEPKKKLKKRILTA